MILGQYNSDQIKLKFKNVEFINLQDDLLLKYLYSCVEINLTLSLYENLPYSITESMSCDVTNIAFNVGGIKEIIDHKKNGWIAKKGNVDSVCKGISWVLKNKKRLKNKSRNKILEKFDEKKIIRNVKDIKKNLNLVYL